MYNDTTFTIADTTGDLDYEKNEIWRYGQIDTSWGYLGFGSKYREYAIGENTLTSAPEVPYIYGLNTIRFPYQTVLEISGSRGYLRSYVLISKGTETPRKLVYTPANNSNPMIGDKYTISSDLNLRLASIWLPGNSLSRYVIAKPSQNLLSPIKGDSVWANSKTITGLPGGVQDIGGVKALTYRYGLVPGIYQHYKFDGEQWLRDQTDSDYTITHPIFGYHILLGDYYA